MLAFTIKSKEEYRDTDLQTIMSNACSLDTNFTDRYLQDEDLFESRSVDKRTFGTLSKILEEFPQLNEIFAKLQRGYVIACKTTFKEIIKALKNNRLPNDEEIPGTG